MKKQFFLKLLFLGVCISLQPLFPFVVLEEDNSELDEDFIEVEAAYDSDLSKRIENLARQQAQPIDCVDVVRVLTTGPLKLQDVLQLDVYHKTNPLNIRNLHDLPSLQPLRDRTNCWSFYIEPFAFFMRKAFFTKCSPFLKDYIALLATPVNDFLELIPEELADYHIQDILALFSPMKMEQRRAGVMFGFDRKFGNWNINLFIPVYYNELNFQLTDAEKAAIRDTPFFDGAPGFGSTQDDLDDYTEKHLARDAFGLGDIRIRADYRWFIHDKHLILFGGEITFPSSVAFARGIFGGRYGRCCPQPTVDLGEITTLALQIATLPPSAELTKAKAELTDNVEDLLTDVLDRLTSNLAHICV